WLFERRSIRLVPGRLLLAARGDAMQMEAGVKSLMAQAERAAQKRGQQASTAHLLLVMLQGQSEVSGLLRDEGIRETDLLNALRVVDEEALNTLDRAMERSRQLAAGFGHSVPTPWHLLLAITRDSRSAGHRSLAKMGLGAARIHDQVLQQLNGDPNPERAPRMVRSEAKRVLSAKDATRRPKLRAGPSVTQPMAPKRAISPIRRVKPKPVREAQPRTKNRSAGKTSRPVARRGVNAQTNQQWTTAYPIIIDPMTGQAANDVEVFEEFCLDAERFPTLHKFGRDLTALARAGGIDPVIGRDAEIQTLLDVLARRRSNNPILVGPPGVGKTAIVEGMARYLATSEGPLADRIVIELSAGSLISGTGVRGALAQRVAALRKELALAEGRVLLFIDEIHAIVGDGGADDLAHELKAGLARGELSCIGATTDREYRRYFEKDPALVRRFSPIRVGEPSEDDAITILKGVSPRYAEHHGVSIDDEAIEAAVKLSVRFLPESHLPDKAISVLDLAGARVRRRGKSVVDREAVASVIAERAKVPLERLMMRDGERLLRLESLLGERVVGHTAPISSISDALRKSAAGVRGKRPLGTFLFLGPTGVGKTEMAKAMSDVFFPGTGMTRLDMSEFSEKHSVARLFGAPPGYIGHDDGGQLTDAIRRSPYQLILLDEIEKAHPDVLLSLLPLLDEGRLTDSKGLTVDGSNAIIVMTSNLGAAASGRRSIGFGDEGGDGRTGKALAAVRAALPPELFNRIDEPLFFAPLSLDEVSEIASRLLAKVAASMKEQGVTLRIGEGVIGALIDAGGYDAALGARPMKRVIGREIESLLATGLLRGDFSAKDEVLLHASEGRITFQAV
ncbi:MAG: ATP-dependent Clp protease ATP-binding subunit ClpC, partial [Polyangiales bacterium]